MKAQGIGVHTPEEIEELGKNDLKVLSEVLGDKPYFFGDEPTNVSRSTNWKLAREISYSSHLSTIWQQSRWEYVAVGLVVVIYSRTGSLKTSWSLLFLEKKCAT